MALAEKKINPSENNATFYKYSAEDRFVYPGEMTDSVNATIMQTYALKYKQGVK